MMFTISALYSRKDIYQILNVPVEKQKGNWNTGYNKYKDEYFLFININEPGRTGHNYHNHWDGELLYWRGKTRSHFGEKTIQDLLDSYTRIHIFTREDSRDVKFKYHGLGIADHFENTVPFTIYWRLNTN